MTCTTEDKFLWWMLMISFGQSYIATARESASSVFTHTRSTKTVMEKVVRHQRWKTRAHRVGWAYSTGVIGTTAAFTLFSSRRHWIAYLELRFSFMDWTTHIKGQVKHHSFLLYLIHDMTPYHDQRAIVQLETSRVWLDTSYHVKMIDSSVKRWNVDLLHG